MRTHDETERSAQEQAAWEEYMADEARLDQKLREEQAREEALAQAPEVKELHVQIELEAAVQAYMAEHDPNNTQNGTWKIDIEPGLFEAYGVDTRIVRPHFAQAGNYYDPRAKVDEFSIDAYFDPEEIYRQASDLSYPAEYTDEELEEAIDYDKSVIRSAARDQVEMEIYGRITEKLIGRRVYYIEWI